jgi:tetratricopeptide (TPR) repeat protein
VAGVSPPPDTQQRLALPAHINQYGAAQRIRAGITNNKEVIPMAHAIDKPIVKASSIITLTTLFLFPLFMLPFTTNFFEFNKLTLLVASTGLLLLLWGVRTIVTKSMRLTLVPLALPLLAFGVINFISPFIANPANVVEPLMGRAGFFLVLSLFFLAATNLITDRRFVRHAVYALIGSATVMSIISLFQSFGFGLSTLINQLAGTSLSNDLLFTPAGNLVSLLTFLIPVTILALILAFTKSEAGEKVSLFVLSAIMASAIMVVAVYSFPGKDTSPVFLPLQAGYAIAIDTLKMPKTAIFGVGSGSFMSAFNQFKPALLNAGPYWNIRFISSSTEVLHLITTVGLLGLAAFIWIISSMRRLNQEVIRSLQVRALKVAAFGLLIFFFIIPGSFLLYFTFAAVTMLWSLAVHLANQNAKVIDVTLDTYSSEPQTIKKIGIYAPAALVVLLVGAAYYFTGSAYAADQTLKRSFDAAAQNDGLQTYELQRQAILQNPYVARYRRAYASTNLALANAIAANEEISDDDRNNIAQLIQQAIREAKIAASIEPTNAVNWETLAVIYRSLINAAEGADQWTIAAVSQAILTDPLNPALRVELGGIYFSLGAYDQAIRLFQQAAELKPDYANAYYNLSHSYQQKQDWISAYDYMQQALQFVAQDSADYSTARDELTALAEKLPQQDQAAQTDELAPAQGELQLPEVAPSPTTNIELPEDSGPQDLPTPTTP